ncbi:serine hydrolase [uncultured Reyranella sp.]|uniref:serine hydrolase domain-containing protein n=1 Tax=uncultured Reyranella sp. TaxID=735512 RepID=UPI0025E88381|nr:serine hydrolase [uncultured Reyranella sp.]
MSQNTPITLATWRTASVIATAFRTVPDFIPTARIAAAPAPSDLPEGPTADFAAFDVALAPDRHFDLPALLAATATDAFLVLQHGRIVHETYGNGLDAGTPHILMSMSKAVTGLVASLLAEAGTLDLEAPVSTLVPGIAETSWRGATLCHLLDMRAGAALDAATLAAYAAATGWEALPAGAPPADLARFFAGMAPAPGTHGGVFKYDSANTDLLGLALERATGKSYAELVSEHLWQPMGAVHDAFITVDGRGAARCSGGVCAIARDVARLGQLVLDGGRRGPRQVVPARVIDDLWTGGDAGAWRTGQFGASFGAMGLGTTRYRNGWYIVDGPPRLLFAMGIHGQNLFVVPDHGLVIVKLSSLVTPIDPPAITLAHRAVTEVARLLSP